MINVANILSKNLSTEECVDDLIQIKENLVSLRDVDSKRLVASLLHDKDFIAIFKRLYDDTTSLDIFDSVNGQALRFELLDLNNAIVW